MVIPMPALPVFAGAPPPEVQEQWIRLKWSVVGMIVFGTGRLIFAAISGVLAVDMMGLLSLFISIVMGAFIFKDDEHLSKVYGCLASSICQVCAEGGQSGMQCLMPFLMVTGMNALFDFLLRFRLLSVMPFGLFLGGTLASEFAAVFFAWQIFSFLRGQSGGGGGSFMDAERGGGVPMRDGPGNQDGQYARVQPGGFQPFGGAGNRLGA